MWQKDQHGQHCKQSPSWPARHAKVVTRLQAVLLAWTCRAGDVYIATLAPDVRHTDMLQSLKQECVNGSHS